MISKGLALRNVPQRELPPYSREKLKSILAMASWHMSYCKPVFSATFASGLVSISVASNGLAANASNVATVAPMQSNLPCLFSSQPLAHIVPSAEALSLILKSMVELFVLSASKDLIVAMIKLGRFHTRATCKALKLVMISKGLDTLVLLCGKKALVLQQAGGPYTY